MTRRPDNDDYTGAFASPPCFMHEVDPVPAGTPDSDDPQQRTDVKRWRKAARARVFGVGYTLAAVPTIYPQRHDIPMNVVVTEDGIIVPASKSQDSVA